MKRVLFTLALFLATASAALAQTTTVVVPVGSWVDQIVPTLEGLAVTAVSIGVAIAVRFLPSWLQGQATATLQAQVNEILDHAIDWAIAAVAGATKDKTLTIPVANSVVASAVQYVIDHGPSWIIAQMGGKDLIAQKVISRIQSLLPDDAKVVGNATIAPALPAPVAGGVVGGMSQFPPPPVS